MSATSEVSTPLGKFQEAYVDAKAHLRKQIAVALATAAVGGVIGFCWIIVFLARVQIAVTFLGARVVFGVPVAEIDALNIVWVALASFGGMAYGAFVFTVGCGIALMAHLRNRPF